MRLSLLAALGLTCATTSLAACGNDRAGGAGDLTVTSRAAARANPATRTTHAPTPGPTRHGSLYVTDDQSGTVYRITP
jgi:hypothetical protein